MDENKMNTDVNNVKISEEVIQTIAGIAVGEVKGLSLPPSLAEGLVEKFVKKNYGKGVRIEMNENEVSLEIHVFVEYGLKIQPLAAELQETIKCNIENMTNLTVVKVDVMVDGINIAKEPKKKDPAIENEG